MIITTVGLDADDTLWHNETVFRLTQARFLDLLTDHDNAAIQARPARSSCWAALKAASVDRAGWPADGQPLAYAPYDLSKGFTGVFNLYRDSLEAAPTETEIPVERIAGPELMLSGAADTLWPSAEMAGRVERRLRAHGFTHEVINIVYPDAEHAVFGAPVAADAPGLQNAIYVGGTVPGLVAARADGWPRVLAFLHQALDGAG